MLFSITIFERSGAREREREKSFIHVKLKIHRNLLMSKTACFRWNNFNQSINQLSQTLFFRNKWKNFININMLFLSFKNFLINYFSKIFKSVREILKIWNVWKVIHLRETIDHLISLIVYLINLTCIFRSLISILLLSSSFLYL